MEFKDWITIGISVLALMVAGGAATFSYWQFALNKERDARELERDRADRTPIITYNVSRPGAQRRFFITFEITNRRYYEVRLISAQLEGAGQTIFITTVAAADAPPLRGMHAPAINMGLMRFEDSENKFAIEQRLTWPVAVDIADTEALPNGTSVNFNFQFRLLDNDERTITVPKAVRLN